MKREKAVTLSALGQGKKLHSINFLILRMFIIAIVIVVLVISVALTKIAGMSAQGALEFAIDLNTQEYEARVSAWLNGEKRDIESVAQEFSVASEFSAEPLDLPQATSKVLATRMSFPINSNVERAYLGFSGKTLVQRDGVTTQDLSAQEWYSRADSDAATYISAPFKRDGKTLITFSTPVQVKGTRGVLAFDVDADELDQMIANSLDENDAYVFLVDQASGKILFHRNAAYHVSENGMVSLSEASYEPLAQAISSNTLYGMLSDFDGVERMMHFKAVPDTDWYVVNLTSMVMMNRDLSQLYLLAAILAIAVILVSVFIVKLLTKQYFRSFTQLTDEILVFSKGNLHAESEVQANSKEFSAISGAVQELQERLTEYVSIISSTLNQIADSNLTASIDSDFMGDFAPIQVSL